MKSFKSILGLGGDTKVDEKTVPKDDWDNYKFEFGKTDFVDSPSSTATNLNIPAADICDEQCVDEIASTQINPETAIPDSEPSITDTNAVDNSNTNPDGEPI
jgi:hypothetical protein